MHVLCIFSTNLTLGIRTKDLHSMVHSRKPVVVSIECPQPKIMAPYWPPKLKVPETPLIESRHLSINAKNYESLRTNEVVGAVVKELIA